jgi:hypothetical protein
MIRTRSKAKDLSSESDTRGKYDGQKAIKGKGIGIRKKPKGKV